jgi:putative FmdB family regulatory protein
MHREPLDAPRQWIYDPGSNSNEKSERERWVEPGFLRVPIGHQSSGSNGGSAMPVYEFRCKKCSKTFDETETFAEHDKHPEVKCPHCGSADVEPIMTPVEVRTRKKS